MSGFSFGTPQPAAGTGFAFGASNTQPAVASQAPPSFGFGTPAVTAIPTLGATPQLGTTPTLGSFGTPTLGAPAATAAVAPTASAAATGITFGTSAPPYGATQQSTSAAAPSFSFSTVTSAPTLGLSFGTPVTATTAASQAPTLGASTSAVATTTAAAQNVAPAFGGFGASAATTSPWIGGGFCSTTTTTTATVSNSSTQKIGLGGVDINAAQPKTIEGQTDSAKVKENQLPQEIIATVDSLKAYTNQQKTIGSDIVRASSRKITNVNSELDTLNWALAEIHSNVESNFAAIKQLRAETNKARQEAEIAQRTHETPAGLQFENTAPLQYFMELVQKFESDMLTIRKQLELTETHIRSLTNPQTFTADDLKKGLQQIHECFVALAGRLQETHRAVETQNEQFINLMKHRGRDKVNIYDGGNNSAADGSQPIIQQIASGCRAIIPNVACGPTPFSSFRNEPAHGMFRNSADRKEFPTQKF
ncbi:nuclear pore complex protein Nup58 isoform X2 [Sitodiplosis mosellana]|uniref:nuclear pore complex protein Nup58 isoform X2 n=1 Tax=Sitodiplosis mosellana TaxID=263140 RepID=UPI0024437510|nr:nuclear pore complex protein Nup58 isoform X2 [Sitodiplosis mosellana]